MLSRCLPIALVAAILWTLPVQAQVDPAQRTALMPDSWLVLYNLNDSDSIAWKDWYIRRRGIPAENTLGLNVSTQEHVSNLERLDILDAVAVHLAANPQLESKIMGIVVGYRIPLHGGTNTSFPPGGFSVDGMLTDLGDAINETNPDASFGWPSYDLPARKTKATMAPDHYMVARIGAPSLDQAKELTRRALNIECRQICFLSLQKIFFDFQDPTNGTWNELLNASFKPALASLPWQVFDSDLDVLTDDAFRFGWHRVSGWDQGFFDGTSPAHRVLAYNLDSWGATTIRSTTGDGGRYVPNALWNGGYAAAIGATSEPGFSNFIPGPFVAVLMEALQNDWTLGEAFYAAVKFDDWQWILVGDPLLTIPLWFGETPPPGRLVSNVCAATVGILAVQSCMDHGQAGEFCLDLTNNPIEPRRPGVVRLALELSTDVAAVTAVVDCGDGLVTAPAVSIGAGTVGPSSRVTLLLADPLPDARCCQVLLDGDAITEATVWPLRGDLNRDGVVSTGDASILRSDFNSPANAANFVSDFNANGFITTGDFSQVRWYFGDATVACPGGQVP
ncbi:MAG: dockerin type I domain-containing protein [Phycisphaerae bacterium]